MVMVVVCCIVVIGMCNVYLVVLYLCQQLLQVCGQVLVLFQSGQSFSEELVDLIVDDLVVVMVFCWWLWIVCLFLQQLQCDGVLVLLMCELQVYSLFLFFCWQFCVLLDSVLVYDSYVLVNSLINLLVNVFLYEMFDSGCLCIYDIVMFYQ